ncbi:glycosyl transferase [Cryptosporidium ubiquitum]|uniref:Glycosyl transferase n=1 Tax=Cryptosporidium ubiquitum TaxID=857276 RepID=A0A1J4MJM8_9CRYT|nr:glycosyl transferase [Cryptosporidium ubiquitum]OII74466.1 glycosyl transferase [Cryptosporidium ubiquitum]
MRVLKVFVLVLIYNLKLLFQKYLTKTEICEFSFLELKNRNNWAVIVSTSRYWHNYRHNTNALSFYNFLRQNGFKDDRVILMLAENIPCNTRNSIPGGVYSEDYDLFYNLNNYTQTMECADTDYKEEEVTVSNFIRVLTGKHDISVPNKKRLLSDENSNIFIFLTGHGGDGFLKFQDFEEMTSLELSNAIKEMKTQKRFKKIFIISETCQASTLHNHLDLEDVYAIGCSSLGQSSYSKHYKSELGVASIDRFTHFSLADFKNLNRNKLMPIISLIGKYSINHLKSTPQIKYKSGKIDIKHVYVNEFFFPNIEKVITLDIESLILNYIDLKTPLKQVLNKRVSKFLNCSLFNHTLKKYSSNLNLLESSNCHFKDTIKKFVISSQKRAIFNSTFSSRNFIDSMSTLKLTKAISGLSATLVIGFILSYYSAL